MSKSYYSKIFCIIISLISILSLPCVGIIGSLHYMDVFFKMIEISIVPLIVLSFCVQRVKLCISYMTIAVMFYALTLLLSTILNGSSIRSCMAQTVPIIIISFLFDYFVTDINTFVSGLMILCELICYLNLLTIIAFPRGLYNDGYYWQNWLLGYRNKFSIYLIVVLLIAYIHGQLTRMTLRSYLLYLACLISAFMVKSSTQVIGYILIVIFLVAIDVMNLKTNPYILMGINILLYFAITMIGTHSKIIDWVLGFINRDITYSGRTIIWNKLIILILKSPLFGYGVQANSVVSQQLGFRWATQAHNLVLQILFQGGIVSLVAYCIIVFLCLKNMHSFQEYKIVQGFMIILFAYYIMALMESFGGTGFTWILFFVCYYSGRFVQAEKENIFLNKCLKDVNK